MGEEVCAWIIRKTTSSIGAEDIIKFCEGNISKFKIPKYIKFVDKFPINANNKVQKMLLREQAIKEYNLA
jgi:fatty-acyl-CoA synthase